MENLFVPQGLAEKLQGIGFKEKCMAFYEDDKQLTFICTIPMDKSVPFVNITGKVCAPMYQQIIDWFQNKQSMLVSAPIYTYSVDSFKNTGNPKFKFKSCVFCFTTGEHSYGVFDDKYKALNVAIDEAIKMI